MIWFTSDWHLGHKNIIEYDNRPFTNVDEMNKTIIDNCNKVVDKDDILYYLGDFAFLKHHKRPVEEIRAYRERIKCKNIHFVLGNHDKDIRKSKHLFKDVFLSINDLIELKYYDKSITLCHYSMRVWNKSHHGSWHLYGHSHHNLPWDDSYSFDVGINGWEYHPLSFADVCEIMSEKVEKCSKE